jgi:hypothetical protein
MLQRGNTKRKWSIHQQIEFDGRFILEIKISFTPCTVIDDELHQDQLYSAVINIIH